MENQVDDYLSNNRDVEALFKEYDSDTISYVCLNAVRKIAVDNTTANDFYNYCMGRVKSYNDFKI